MEKEYYFRTHQLAIWRPSGILDSKKIHEFVIFLNRESERRDPHFNRFIDLCEISGISVNFSELYQISRDRKIFHSLHLRHNVKMVFLVNNSLSFGMARMYQTLYDDPKLKITICEDITEASNLLEVEKEILRS